MTTQTAAQLQLGDRVIFSNEVTGRYEDAVVVFVEEVTSKHVYVCINAETALYSVIESEIESAGA